MFGSIIRAVFCRGRVLYPFTALKHLDFPHRKEHVSSFDCVWVASDESLRNDHLERRIKKDTALRAVSPPLMYLSRFSQAPHSMHRRRCFYSRAEFDLMVMGTKGGSG